MGVSMSPAEKKLLKKIAEANVITKPELKYFLQENGSKSNNIDVILDSATKNLLEKDFISLISPVGSTCYIITQKGSRFIRD